MVEDDTIVDEILLGSDSRDRGTLWFFLEENPDEKVPLRNGEPVSVGRSRERDVHVDDRTVSREHIVLIRADERVRIDIKGRNGIVLDDKLYVDQTIECLPPVSFTMGSVRCHLDFDVDDEKTVCIGPVSSDVYGTPVPPSAPLFGEGQGDLPVKEYERPATPAGVHVSGRDIHAPPTPGATFQERDYPRGSGDSAGGPFPSAHRNFGPRIVGGRGDMWRGAAGDLWLRKGGPVMVFSALFVLGIFLLFLLFPKTGGRSVDLQYRQEIPETAKWPAAPEKTVAADRSEVEMSDRAYHRALIELAEALIRQNDPEAAMDYLLDIPKSSPSYERARELMESIGRGGDGRTSGD